MYCSSMSYRLSLQHLINVPFFSQAGALPDFEDEGIDLRGIDDDEEDEEAIAFGGNGNDGVVLDGVPDPHVPQGELARRFHVATILGEQKRWDICNDLPME